MEDDARGRTLATVLSSQNLGVLATDGREYPYTSLVGFAATKDLRNIVFATSGDTRKYRNLKRHPGISMLINNGANIPDDFKRAVAVTVLGAASDVPSGEKKEFEELYLTKFPFMKDFVNDPSCVLVKIEVDKYILVSRFREVEELVP